ncbi:unnamed protein product [Allacma fusca]|uniref:ribose-5-phosphate isomerase n=1 Tax=Allacma fusca TaxID=39272 RepID=A0A8J2LH48_9HEXA|nr:unnamed protein product [Allacma fusca]
MSFRSYEIPTQHRVSVEGSWGCDSCSGFYRNGSYIMKLEHSISRKHRSDLETRLVSCVGFTMSARGLIEQAKRLAARRAVDDHIKDGQIVGIGSGSTVVYVAQRLAERVKEEGLNVTCIPTSFQAKNLIIDNNLALSDLDVHSKIDVTIDGCDECDADLNLIKGGGGCLLQEKIVAAASDKLIIVADYTKDSVYLGEQWKKGIPLEISSIGWKVVERKLNDLSIAWGSKTGLASVRMAIKKMGPVVTDNSNFIIDFNIGDLEEELRLKLPPKEIEVQLKSIPGILETGLFVKMAKQVYFGQNDGSVKTRAQ